MDTIRVDEGLAVQRDWRALDALLGERIRHRRHTQKLSLKALAERSGISIGLLSQIERGLSSPSLRVIASLAEALKIGLADLFGDQPEAGPPPDKIVVRAEERRKLSFWRIGISKELLTPHAEDSTLDIFSVVIEPGGTSGSQLYSHEGHEGGLLLEGELVINVDGTEHHLRAGDGFRFASTRLHSFRNPGAATARVVWVNARSAALPQRKPPTG